VGCRSRSRLHRTRSPATSTALAPHARRDRLHERGTIACTHRSPPRANDGRRDQASWRGAEQASSPPRPLSANDCSKGAPFPQQVSSPRRDHRIAHARGSTLPCGRAARAAVVTRRLRLAGRLDEVAVLTNKIIPRHRSIYLAGRATLSACESCAGRDDDRAIRESLARGVERRATTCCGRRRVEELRWRGGTPLDALVLDVMMPNIDGLGVLPGVAC